MRCQSSSDAPPQYSPCIAGEDFAQAGTLHWGQGYGRIPEAFGIAGIGRFALFTVAQGGEGRFALGWPATSLTAHRLYIDARTFCTLKGLRGLLWCTPSHGSTRTPLNFGALHFLVEAYFLRLDQQARALVPRYLILALQFVGYGIVFHIVAQIHGAGVLVTALDRPH